VVPWTNGGARLLIKLLRNGVKVRSLDKPFRLNGRDFVPAPSSRARSAIRRLPALIRDAAARERQVVPTDTSWVESSIRWQQQRAPRLPPKVAIAWDARSAQLAGWARFLPSAATCR
jgi:hypothetical protein